MQLKNIRIWCKIEGIVNVFFALVYFVRPDLMWGGMFQVPKDSLAFTICNEFWAAMLPMQSVVLFLAYNPREIRILYTGMLLAELIIMPTVAYRADMTKFEVIAFQVITLAMAMARTRAIYNLGKMEVSRGSHTPPVHDTTTEHQSKDDKITGTKKD